MEKKRVIVDYKNITNELLTMLTEKYPYGFDDFIIRFKNAKGEMINAVPMETEDTKYLVKMSVQLDKRVEAFLDDDDDSDASDDLDVPTDGIVGDDDEDDDDE